MGTDCKFVGVLVLCAMISSAGSYPAAASTASIGGKNDAESGQTTSAGTERVNERLRQLVARFKDHQRERNDRLAKLVADILAYSDKVRLPPPAADQKTPTLIDEVDSSDVDRKDDDDTVDVAPGTKRASAAWDMDYGWGGGRFGKRRDRLGWAGRFGRSVPQQVVA